MINNPSIDELANKVGSKYALCVIASKRARQLVEQSQSAVATEPLKEKPLSMAAKEIQEGKLVISND